MDVGGTVGVGVLCVCVVLLTFDLFRKTSSRYQYNNPPPFQCGWVIFGHFRAPRPSKQRGGLFQHHQDLPPRWNFEFLASPKSPFPTGFIRFSTWRNAMCVLSINLMLSDHFRVHFEIFAQNDQKSQVHKVF